MLKKSLIPIYIIYFLDNFSFASLFPLFSTLILSNESILFPEKYDLMMRNMLFGALSGAFPLGAFLGAPLIGNAADTWGRKKVFFLILTGIMIGNLLTVGALFIGSYFFLVLSRLFTGLFSANLTLCHSVVSDLTPSATQRAKHFGVLAACSGASWLVALGFGSLSNHAQFSPTTPFLFSGCLAALNLIIVAYFTKETAPESKDPLKFSLAYDRVMYTFHSSNIRKLTGSLFLFSAGWLLTLQWFSGVSAEKFHIDTPQLIHALAILGGCWILGSTLLNRGLIRTLRLPLIPLCSLLALALFLGAAGFLNSYPLFTLANVLAASLASLTLCNLLTLFSTSAPAQAQGKILGIAQSTIAAAQFIVPMAGGLFLIGGFLTFYISLSLIILCAGFLFWKDLNLLNNQKKH
jgi:MFS family permease